MHELTLCEQILDILDDERRRRGFVALRRLAIEIGRFGCVDPDALVFALETTTRGGWLDGTAFEVTRLPGRVTCLDCDADVEIEERVYACPTCGSTRLARSGGDEMRLVEMEVIWPKAAPVREDAPCASPCP